MCQSKKKKNVKSNSGCHVLQGWEMRGKSCLSQEVKSNFYSCCWEIWRVRTLFKVSSSHLEKKLKGLHVLVYICVFFRFLWKHKIFSLLLFNMVSESQIVTLNYWLSDRFYGCLNSVCPPEIKISYYSLGVCVSYKFNLETVLECPKKVAQRVPSPSQASHSTATTLLHPHTPAR